MGYPDFVCMGFQKCGTTTLYDILAQHPQVALCRDVKEPMYYRIPAATVPGFGSVYYRKRYFGHVRPGDPRKKGEVNAGLTFSGCADRLKRHMSHDTKMIFMLRNPVDRSYSAYKYFLARGFLPAHVVEYDARFGHARGFDHYVHSVLKHPYKRDQIMKQRMHYLIFSQSNYMACISELLDTFDVRNMKFVIFEEFVADQHQACREIYDFVGIQDSDEINYQIRANEGCDCAVSGLHTRCFYFVKGIRYFFYDLLAMPHWAPGVYQRFENAYQRIRRRCLIPDKDKSKVLPSTRRYLEAYYGRDICNLEKLIGRDLHEVWSIG